MANAPSNGFDTEFSGPLLESGKFVNVFRSTLTGYSFAFDDRTSYYVPVAHRQGNAPAWCNRRPLDLLRETIAPVAIHNAKNEHHLLGWLPTNFDCTQVMCWMLEIPGAKGSYSLEALLQKHLDYEKVEFVHDRSFCEYTPLEALDYACVDAEGALDLRRHCLNHPDWSLVRDCYHDIDRPLVPVLAKMERRGMSIDREHLLQLADRLHKHTEELKQEWEFNFPDVSITSPKQVRDYFFGEKLWPTSGVDKTSTGLLSVNRNTMELALAHQRTPKDGKIAASIRLEFQDAHKILNTYTHSLVAKADQHVDGRLHPSFLQTGTRTGRLSCIDPNLMNIPVRSKLGLEVKKAFNAAPGHKLLSADYSQLELRVLAHMAGPGKLRDAFAPDRGDFFDQMAEDLDQPRHYAKTGMYAYVYGASGRKIGKTLGIGDKAGYQLIKDMERTYPELVTLKDTLLSYARARGYCRTLGGRLRRLEQLHDGGWLQGKDERRAGNTPIQGSGADIVKLAMLALDKAGFQMTCQVHDEIVCEETLAFSGIRNGAHMQQLMESAFELSVPLVAKPVVVDTWDQTK